MSRLLSAAPGLSGSPQFDLSELRDSIRPECNLDLESPFSATMVVPVGPWLNEMFSGRVSLGGDSFCTVTAVGTHIEVAIPSPGSQLLNTIRGCLPVGRRAWQAILNDSFRRALQCAYVTTRTTTSRMVQQGKNKCRRYLELAETFATSTPYVDGYFALLGDINILKKSFME
jgi:hypothetical protein